MKTCAVLLALAVALAALPVAAQDVRIEAKPPEREPREIVTPGLLYDQTRPSDRDYYPDGPRVEHDPAFIESLSGEYQTATSRGRAGIAGWTAPNTPVGSSAGGYKEVTGWLGFGFSVTWGGPPTPAPRPPAPAR